MSDSNVNHVERKDPAHIKVFGLGLGRTGTYSLCKALEKLGFGPCLHTINLNPIPADYWHKFIEAIKNGSPEVLDDIFRVYVSALDGPVAGIAESVYKAYPDAKYILTVRDNASKWAESMRKTVLPFVSSFQKRNAAVDSGTAWKENSHLDKFYREWGFIEWLELRHPEYYRNREPDLEGEYLRHNQRIAELIPPEKLLVFNVKEGWKPLVHFLGVSEPDEPFPNVNDSKTFQEALTDRWVGYNLEIRLCQRNVSGLGKSDAEQGPA